MMTKPELLSGPQLEKLIRQKPAGSTLKAERKKFSDAVMERHTSIKMVDADDKGDPVTINVGADFDDDGDFLGED
jgi:hypothetical protein